MRISASTIVMAGLVCVPFGLAIRDTIRGPAAPAFDRGDDDDDSAESPDELARYEAEEAERAAARHAQEERDEQARKAALSELLGAEPATLGGAFGKLHLGEPNQLVIEQASQRFQRDEPTRGYIVQLVGEHGLDAIQIWPDSGDSGAGCTDLDARLTEVWGVYEYDEHESSRVWLNRALGQRAVFVRNGMCAVTIEPYVDAARFVSKTRDSIVPLDAIGRPLAALQARYPFGNLEGDALTWTSPGIGVGAGKTTLTALTTSGKVTSISASTQMSSATRDAVVESLRALYGVPTDDNGMLVWKKAHVSFDPNDSGASELVIGAHAGE